MSLRTKLVLAFLLLAIVPLSALTLYSYYSSIQTFRRVAEVESNEITRNMSERMELVSRDLDTRLNRLGQVPFQELMNQRAGSRQPSARGLYQRLMSEFGEAAGLISALEFRPEEAASPAPPGTGESDRLPPPGRRGNRRPPPFPRRGPRPPAPVARSSADGSLEPPQPPESMIFYFPNTNASPEVSNRETETREIETLALQAARSEEEQDAEIIVRQEEQRLIIEATQLQAQQIADRLVQRANRVSMAVVHGLSQVAGPEAAAALNAKVGETLEGMGVGLKDMVGKVLAQPEAREFLGKTLDYAIHVSGEQVGTIRAQVDSRRVVGRVFSAARRRQGEIPFAIDQEGNLFTQSEEDREKLAGLNLESLTGQPELAREMGDWLLVSRQEPNSEMVFGIARPIAYRLQEIKRTAIYNLLFGLGIVGVALVGILPLSGRMTRNLETLSDGARKLATGNLDTQVPVRSRDEFGKLALSFNRMAVQLKEQRTQLVEQERIRKELEMCRLIQEELLPQQSLQVPFAEVRGVSIPAREVGGDFFNYFDLGNGKIAILIGDVSGKGVAAALLMANLQATLRARVPVEPNLAKLSTELDLEIHQQTPPATYLTLFLGILDGQTGVMRWVNAGHNPQYALHSDGSIEKLESGGRPLGLLPGGEYTEGSIQFGPADALFLYTDGLVEAENSENEEFGELRLENALHAVGDEKTDAILTRIEEAARDHRSGVEAGDDATMVVLRLSPVILPTSQNSQ